MVEYLLAFESGCTPGGPGAIHARFGPTNHVFVGQLGASPPAKGPTVIPGEEASWANCKNVMP